MLLSEMLDPMENSSQLLEVESDRGFLTITGVCMQACTIMSALIGILSTCLT